MVTFAHDRPGTPASAWTEHPRSGDVPELDLADVERLVVVAAHPDDESLGAGGLLARAHRLGWAIEVVAATDGGASHPDSPTHTPERLATIRRAELQDAVAATAPGASVRPLGLPDSGLADHEDHLARTLVDLVGDGRRTLLVAPWRRDAHPDHEAAGRAAATASVRTGARLLEYPVWFWHWGDPEDAPWPDLRALTLDDADRDARARAQAAHHSQVVPLSDRAGDEVLLGPELLEHFAGPREHYVAQEPDDAALDDLHAAEEDPWGTDSRFYEIRKRALLLAALPRARFRHGLEVGSSTGALAAALAERCEELLVLDASPAAVSAARARLSGSAGATVRRAAVPADWPAPPAGGFDLVVLSEVGYFLSPAALDGVVARVRTSLAADGVLVLAHWRHEVAGWPLDGPAVHAAVVAAAVRPVVARYADRDVELLVLADPSVLPDPREDG